MEHDHPAHRAVVVFDGQDPDNNKLLSDCFTSFMAKTSKGRAMTYIVPSPLFAGSSLTPGLQIADLFSYVLRENYENDLLKQRNLADPYFSSLARYGRIIKNKTVDYGDIEGGTAHGIRTMSADKFSTI